MAEQKVEALQGNLREAETKHTEAASIVSTCDKELVDLKETMNACNQAFYNMGFTNTEKSANAVILQARRHGFLEGWMVVVNAIGLPKSFAFRNPDQIPLTNDPPVQAPT